MPPVTTRSIELDLPPTGQGPSTDARGPSWRRRALVLLGVAAASVALFRAYLSLAHTRMVNADGSANAIQAWDMMHGNPLLTGWTLSDVAFYTTEVPQYALIELFYGYRADVVRVGAAMTYVLLILLAAVVAKGRSTGWAAAIRAGLAVAILILPGPGTGYSVLLSSPDHTGTAVPLLVTWLVLDRALSARRVRWWLPPVVTVLLVWAQLGDPLAMFIGAVPVIAISTWRVLRAGRAPHPDRRLDLVLLLAGLTSILLTQLAQMAIWAAGGWVTHPPKAQFSEADQWPGHLVNALLGLSVNFGAYFPDLDPRFGYLAGGLSAAGLALVLGAVGYGVVRLLRRRRTDPGDRVSEILTVAVVVNLAAYVLSTQAIGDLGTARQIVAVLPLGAALAGRLLVPQRWAGPRLAAPLGATLLVLAALLAGQVTAARPIAAEAHDLGRWLLAEGHTYGLGAYWASNNITLDTGGRVRVAPVTGPDRIYAYRWESRADWYDAAKHDARFVIVDRARPGYGSEAAVTTQFGKPVQRREFGQFTVLVYDTNLLIGLPASCQPGFAPSIPQCPRLRPSLPGSAILRT